MSELEHTRRAPPLNPKEILDLARRERIVLKTEDGRLLRNLCTSVSGSGINS